MFDFMKKKKTEFTKKDLDWLASHGFKENKEPRIYWSFSYSFDEGEGVLFDVERDNKGKYIVHAILDTGEDMVETDWVTGDTLYEAVGHARQELDRMVTRISILNLKVQGLWKNHAEGENQ